MLELTLTVILSLLLGYLAGRADRPRPADTPDLDQVARRVWPRLQAWRDREITDALAHPDQARAQLIHRLWRRRLGLSPTEPLPLDAQQAIRDVITCPWPARED